MKFQKKPCAEKFAYPCPNTQRFWVLIRSHYKTFNHERVIIMEKKYELYFIIGKFPFKVNRAIKYMNLYQLLPRKNPS